MTEIEFTESPKHRFNLLQYFLLSSCFFPMSLFAKLPLDHALGSGWALLTYFIFFFIYAPVVCFLQFRSCAHRQNTILTIFDQYFPLGICFALCTLCSNLIKLIIGVFFITQCLTYLFYTYYDCDGRHCVGGTYIWGSCFDTWTDGDCRDNYQLVFAGPIPEEKFLINFLTMRSDEIMNGYEFPSWFTYPAVVVLPYILSWLITFALTFGGPHVFGLLLYALSPAAIFLLLVVVLTFGINYADSVKQLDMYWIKFYRLFMSAVPFNKESLDVYPVQPMTWGLLYTFVHLTQAVNLWNGVFPVLGKLSGRGRIAKHLGWIPTLFGVTLFGQFPVLLILYAVSSSYDESYVRCHLGVDWQAPFIILSHVFSKFSSSRLLSGSCFFSLLLFLLLHQSLLLITTVENVVDHLQAWIEPLENQYKQTYRCLICISICVLGLLGLPLITRSGFYWVRLIDWFVDRLFFIPSLGQAVAFLIIYARTNICKKENPFVKALVMSTMGMIITISTGVFIWYVFASAQSPPDYECRTFTRAPENDPIFNRFSIIGWMIAIGPLMLGLLIGLIIIYDHLHRNSLSGMQYFSYLLGGEHSFHDYVINSFHAERKFNHNRSQDHIWSSIGNMDPETRYRSRDYENWPANSTNHQYELSEYDPDHKNQYSSNPYSSEAYASSFEQSTLISNEHGPLYRQSMTRTRRSFHPRHPSELYTTPRRPNDAYNNDDVL